MINVLTVQKLGEPYLDEFLVLEVCVLLLHDITRDWMFVVSLNKRNNSILSSVIGTAHLCRTIKEFLAYNFWLFFFSRCQLTLRQFPNKPNPLTHSLWYFHQVLDDGSTLLKRWTKVLNTNVYFKQTL